MNIALLSYEYPPETGFGGIGSYTYYQARGLAKLGHRVHVVAGSLQPGIHHSEEDGVLITRVKCQGWLLRLLTALLPKRCGWASNRIQTAYAAHSGLRHLLGRESLDWVEFPECGADGSLVATLLDVPTVVKFHSPARLIMGMYDTPRMDRELTAMVEQIGIRQATLRTSCSRFLAEEAKTKMKVRQPIEVIPNGIDLDLFDQHESIDVHDRFNLPRQARMVFFANRMERRKGIHLVKDMCIHVLEKYRDVHFVFAGADTYGYMEKEILPFIKANKLQKRFHFLGNLQLPEVRALLKRIDIFLIPSLWENCPYSCIEAMAASRAIVSSDCGGMPELIEDGVTGLLAANDQATAFISALERVIEDPALAARMGANARRRVERDLTDVGIAARSVEYYQSHSTKM